MIKGVNKRVVEITGTDSEFFEKAVLYVKADKSGFPAEKIDEEAREFLGRIVPVRRRRTLSLGARLAIAAGAAAVFIAAAAICLAAIL